MTELFEVRIIVSDKVTEKRGALSFRKQVHALSFLKQVYTCMHLYLNMK